MYVYLLSNVSKRALLDRRSTSIVENPHSSNLETFNVAAQKTKSDFGMTSHFGAFCPAKPFG